MTEIPPKKHKLAAALTLLLLSLCAMIVLLILFAQRTGAHQDALGRARLREAATLNASFIQLLMQEKTEFVSSVAAELSAAPDLRAPEVTKQLERLCHASGFQRLAVDFPEGDSYTSDGFVVDISDMGYTDEMLLGKPFITRLLAAKIDGAPTISIIVPILRDGTVVAAARGTIYTKALGELLDVRVFDGEGYFYLFDGEGQYLAVSGSKNVLLSENNHYVALEKLSFEAGYSASRFQEDVAAGKSGSTSYSYQGQHRYVEYMPVGINDWNLTIVVPKWVIDQNTVLIQRQVLALVIGLFLIGLAVLLYILFSMKGSRDEIKTIYDKLLVGEKRYRFMMERANNIILEYTLAAGTLEYSDRFTEVFGYAPVTTGVPQSILDAKQVHPEDAAALNALFQGVAEGKADSSAELRIRGRDGGYVWCSVVFATLFDEAGAPVRALGVIENIDKQKQKEIALIIQAEQDQLTDLYNKATTENLIKDFLLHGDCQIGIHALMIIDIDNFKTVNDRLGHFYGDMVLTDLAGSLRPTLRKSDVVGRIGGDEFFVFMKHINSPKVAANKAREICELFRRTFTGEGVSCSISASVGIAYFPQHGVDFETLYKNADIALYAAKAGGKDNYSIYTEGLSPSYVSHRTEIDTLHNKTNEEQ